jgi:predicted phage tail protein
MNLTNHLRRGLLVAAAAASVVAAVGGTARADSAAAATPLSAAAVAAAHAPTPDGAALAAVTAPGAPRAPIATPRSTAVRLTWAAPSSNGRATVNKYRVQRATSAKGPWKTIAKPTVRRYRAGGLKNGTRYYFRVAAHNTAGWSTPSKAVSAVPRTVPTAPLSPTATPGNGTVKLAWAAPSSNGGATINKYAVQRATSATGPWTTIATPTVRSHTVGGLTNGTRHHFRIRAHNRAGYGPASTVVSAVPRTVPTAPKSPTATPGNGTVKLTWQHPSSTGGATIDKYAVQWASSAAGPWVHVDDTIGTTYTATGINNGTANNFRIRAHNAAGWSAPSAVVDTPVFAPGPPSAPLACSASQVGIFGTHSMWLGWQPPLTDGGSAITGYVVELNGPLSLGVSLPTSPLQYQKDNLTPGNYVVRVATVNLVGKSPWCTDDVVIN